MSGMSRQEAVHVTVSPVKSVRGMGRQEAVYVTVSPVKSVRGMDERDGYAGSCVCYCSHL